MLRGEKFRESFKCINSVLKGTVDVIFMLTQRGELEKDHTLMVVAYSHKMVQLKTCLQ